MDVSFDFYPAQASSKLEVYLVATLEQSNFKQKQKQKQKQKEKEKEKEINTNNLT